MRIPTILPSLEVQVAFAEQVERIEALARSLDGAAAKAEAMAAAGFRSLTEAIDTTTAPAGC